LSRRLYTALPAPPSQQPLAGSLPAMISGR
jgi:hypothetical protein